MLDLLRCPSYALPLVVNLTGSVWFFLLIGRAGEFFCVFFVFWGGGVGGVGRRMEGLWGLGKGRMRDLVIVFADEDVELSLTVPITNSLAFLFTVLGEWWAEGKVISRGQSFLCYSRN